MESGIGGGKGVRRLARSCFIQMRVTMTERCTRARESLPGRVGKKRGGGFHHTTLHDILHSLYSIVYASACVPPFQTEIIITIIMIIMKRRKARDEKWKRINYI